MTTALTKKDERVTSIMKLVQNQKEQFGIALGKMIEPDRFVRVCMTEIRLNPALLECSPESLLGSLMRSAQLGLEPDKVLGRAYLIPFGKECTFILGYKGMVELIRRSNDVFDVYAVNVWENEPFHIELGTDKRIAHTPLPPEKRGERRIGSYSVVIFREGPPSFHFMWQSEIEEIRDKFSKSAKGKDSPWQTRATEMEKKTVLRAHAKWLRLAPEAQEAAAHDELVEMGLTKQVYLGEGEVIDAASMKAQSMTQEKADALHEKIKQQKGGNGNGEEQPEQEQPNEQSTEEPPADF